MTVSQHVAPKLADSARSKVNKPIDIDASPPIETWERSWETQSDRSSTNVLRTKPSFLGGRPDRKGKGTAKQQEDEKRIIKAPAFGATKNNDN